MELETVRQALMWCAIFNYALILLWTAMAIWGRDWMGRLCARWYGVPEASVATLNLYGISAYKVAIVLFNLMPFLALTFVRK